VHAAVVTRACRYLWFAFLYAIPAVLVTAMSDSQGNAPALVNAVWLGGWVGCAVHACRARGAVDEARNGGPTWIGRHPDSDHVTERWWDGSAWTAVRIRRAGPSRRGWARIWLTGALVGVLLLIPPGQSLGDRISAAITMCLIVVGFAAAVIALKRSLRITVDGAGVRVFRSRYGLDEIATGSARHEPGEGWALHLTLVDGREVESPSRFPDRSPVEAVVRLIGPAQPPASQRRQQRLARLLAAPAHGLADSAVLVVRGVLRTFVGGLAARGDAGLEGAAERRNLALGLAQGDPLRGDALVRAVEAQPDAPDQLDHVGLGQAGVGAAGAGHDAVGARLDAAHQRVAVAGGRPRMGGEYLANRHGAASFT
jgi:Protein of unknown function (DUF2510)